MRGDLEEAVEPQILTPARGLRLQTEEEAFEHGLVFEKFPEILVKGHSAFPTSRLDKVGAEISNYIFPPTTLSLFYKKRLLWLRLKFS